MTNTDTLILKLPAKLKEQLEAYAVLQGMSLSAFVRYVLRTKAKEVSDELEMDRRIDDL